MTTKKGAGSAARKGSAKRLSSPSSQAQSQMATLLRRWDRVTHYVRSAETAKQACEAAKHDACEALRRIVSLSRGKEISQVLQSVRATAVLSDHRTSDLVPVSLELITLALRSTARESQSASDGDSSWMPPEILAAALEVWEAGSMLPFFGIDPADPFAKVEFASRMRELTLRNPVYPHMLADTCRGIFADSAADADIRAVLGFGGIEAIDAMETAGQLQAERLQARFDRFSDASDALLPIMGFDPARPGQKPKRPRDESRRDSKPPLSADELAIAQEFKEALDGITTNVGEVGSLDLAVIAQRSGHDIATIVRILEAFEYKEQLSIDTIVDRFFAGDNPLRTAPVVRDGYGNFMLVHDALPLPAVREVIEQRLEAAGRRAHYQQNRGRWVEAASIDLLAHHFPHAEVHRGFKYFVPDPKSAVPQIEPETFTKRVEADGLIIVDDVAIIAEVKSVALKPEARGGATVKLRNNLRAIVTDAAEQAIRLRDRIETDKRIRLEDGEWIDCSGIREIHCLAVGLEDLSGVVTATAELVSAGVLRPANIPWTVSFHDLRAICEIIDRPAELLLYLRRRTEPETTVKFRAVDELDLFLLFLDRGLFVEPDPVALSRKFPMFGQPKVGALRRHKAQRTEFVMGRTEPLDDWYNRRCGLDDKHPPKPALKADPGLLELVDAVTATQTPGWLATSVALLEGNSVVQQRFAQTSALLSKLTRRDAMAHDIVQTMISPQGPILLIWRTCPTPQQASREADVLRRHLAAKKHQLGAARASGFLINALDGTLMQLIYDNRIPTPDPQLDEIVKYLRPPDAGVNTRALTVLKRPRNPNRRKRRR